MSLRKQILAVLGIAIVHTIGYYMAWGFAFIAGDSGAAQISFTHSAILHVLGAPLVYLFHGFSFFIAAANGMIWGITIMAAFALWKRRRESPPTST
jgi:predicted DNA repair protein MutK